MKIREAEGAKEEINDKWGNIEDNNTRFNTMAIGV